MPDFSDALSRIGGMYGSAWRDGIMLAESIEVSGSVEVQRIDVPLVGQMRNGHKPGRESREGTLRVQKIDTKWELEIYQFLNQNLAQRRQNRGTAAATIREFTLKLALDDPDAGGYEAWQLNGCKIWRMPLGFAITDDTIDREYPLTWESETPLSTFKWDQKNNVVLVDPHKQL